METVAVAISSLIGLVSIFVSAITLHIQRDYNKKTVLPIGEIDLEDYENRLQISLQNKGNGPLIIRSIKTSSSNISRRYPIDWFENSDILWSDFTKNIETRAIIPGSCIVLLKIEFQKTTKKNTKILNHVRKILMGLTIEVEYLDVYKRSRSVKRDLDWFSRTIS